MRPHDPADRPARHPHLPSGDPVDLSQPLRTALPIVPGDPGVRVESFATHAEDGYAMKRVEFGSHSGTHIDAPRHFFPDGRPLDDYPLRRFLGEAAVIDLRHLPPDSAIPVDSLQGALDAPRRPQAGFVLLWLGWDAHFGDALMWQHPYLTEDGAQALVERGVTLVGTDAASIDRSAVMESFPAHHTLLSNDVLVVENLRGLEQLGGRDALCVFLPIPLAEADGAPVRAIAWTRV